MDCKDGADRSPWALNSREFLWLGTEMWQKMSEHFFRKKYSMHHYCLWDIGAQMLRFEGQTSLGTKVTLVEGTWEAFIPSSSKKPNSANNLSELGSGSSQSIRVKAQLTNTLIWVFWDQEQRNQLSQPRLLTYRTYRKYILYALL